MVAIATNINKRTQTDGVRSAFSRTYISSSTIALKIPQEGLMTFVQIPSSTVIKEGAVLRKTFQKNLFNFAKWIMVTGCVILILFFSKPTPAQETFLSYCYLYVIPLSYNLSNRPLFATSIEIANQFTMLLYSIFSLERNIHFFIFQNHPT